VTPDLERLHAHYAEHEGKPFFEPLVEFMSSGPVTAVVIEGEQCIAGFRALAGATDPTGRPAGHDPRRPRARLGRQGPEEHRPRLGLARVGRARDRHLVPRTLTWGPILRPRVVVGVPSDITGVERRALEDATLRAGARRVYVIEEPMAAALGAGLPIHETAASMVVDIGGGTTDVAVISLGGVVSARSVRIGGDEIDEAIVAHVKGEYSLLLGERTAEHIKVTAGSAFPLREEVNERVRGRDLATGLPKTVVINSAEVRRAIELPLHQIIDLVRGVLDVCPPELAGDILDRGITLTGGGALLRGLDQRLHHELGVPVTVAEDPLRAVARGAGRCVEEFSTLQRVLVDTTRR
jgi:rod shape-determining protein MreB